jgi:hypothetical protein
MPQRLSDSYRFPGLRPLQTVVSISDDPPFPYFVTRPKVACACDQLSNHGYIPYCRPED